MSINHGYNTRNNSQYKTFYENEDDQIYKRLDEIEEKDKKKVFYAGTILWVSLMTIPFAICDLHYASLDEKCLFQKFDTMKISLYEFLLVNGIYTIVAFILDILIHSPNSNMEESQKEKVLNFCEFINRSFVSGWTVVGLVLFLGFVENACSSSLNGYMVVSLTCKVVIYATYLFYSFHNECV